MNGIRDLLANNFFHIPRGLVLSLETAPIGERGLYGTIYRLEDGTVCRERDFFPYDFLLTDNYPIVKDTDLSRISGESPLGKAWRDLLTKRRGGAAREINFVPPYVPEDFPDMFEMR